MRKSFFKTSAKVNLCHRSGVSDVLNLKVFKEVRNSGLLGNLPHKGKGIFRCIFLTVSSTNGQIHSIA